MRPLIITVAVVASVILLLLAAGYLTLKSIDVNKYQPEIIAQVEAATGRKLEIRGKLGIGLDNGLVIRVNGLALANAAWGSRPQFLTLGRAEARVALLPLFSGDIRITEISLRDVDLLLETDASGTPNWVLDSHSTTGALPNFDVHSIVIESGQLTWKTARAPGRPLLRLTELAVEAKGRGKQRVLEASARIGDEKLELEGRVPSFLAYASGEALGLDLQVRTADADIQLKGTIQREAWGPNPRLELSAKRLDVAALGRLAGQSMPALRPLDLALNLSRDAEAWRIVNLEAKAGASDIAGELRLGTLGGRRQLSGSLVSRRFDLAELLPAHPASPDAASESGKIFSATPLKLDALRELDGTLQLALTQVNGWGYRLHDVQLDGRLSSGHLSLSPIKARIDGGGHAGGKFELDVGSDTPSWKLDLKVRQIPTAALLGPQQASLIEALADLDLDLKTRGASFDRMAQNLAGRARLLVGKGRARLQTVDRMVGGLSTVAGQLLERGSADAQLNCAIADINVERGVAKAEILMVDSAASTLRGDGQIDLGAEQVALTFTPRPKKPTLSVAVPVHVRGPLRQPQFIADQKASLTKLIGIAGIFVYPPAALATLGDLGGADNECIRLIRGQHSDSNSSSALDKVGDGIGSAAKGVGKGLKKLFGQ